MNSSSNVGKEIDVEICLAGLESALAAESGGASRVELCENLRDGGVTPSRGQIALACRRLEIPVYVLIRPRAGDFIYSQDEVDIMISDIECARESGAAGVVIGALTSDRKIDISVTERLVEAAASMSVTFHRAFDEVADPKNAVDQFCNLGIERVLSSGQSTTALEGATCLAELIQHANGRLRIMPGGGVSIDNAASILAKCGARDIHVGSAVATARAVGAANVPLGPGGSAATDTLSVTDSDLVRRLVQSVAQL